MTIRLRRRVRWPFRYMVPDWNDAHVDPGGAFWGLVIGLVAYLVLNGVLPRRARTRLSA